MHLRDKSRGGEVTPIASIVTTRVNAALCHLVDRTESIGSRRRGWILLWSRETLSWGNLHTEHPHHFLNFHIEWCCAEGLCQQCQTASACRAIILQTLPFHFQTCTDWPCLRLKLRKRLASSGQKVESRYCLPATPLR